MELTEHQEKIVECEGHLLVQGGPGSGKTTVSIIKADRIISEKLKSQQKVLFLSFSRSAVSRVVEAIKESAIITDEKAHIIQVETYHSFFWQIIKSHGYLLGLPRKLNILLPSAEAVALSGIRSDYDRKPSIDKLKEKEEREQLELNKILYQEGRVCFQAFSKLVLDILCRSKKILKLISTAYPYILLDEFQDTNPEQWEIIKVLGKESILIALADPEQRIFDFIGADPERLNHFKNIFKPLIYDLGLANHRSSGTDISLFGNHILKGKYRTEPYIGVLIVKYPSNQNQAFKQLKVHTLQARKRLLQSGKKNWSLAVLVPTKKLMRQVSDDFRLGIEIRHHAAIDMEGAILSAEVIAFLLQQMRSENAEKELVNLLINFFLGKGGSAPTKGNLEDANRIGNAYKNILEKRSIQKIAKTILTETFITINQILESKFTGDPAIDWLHVRLFLENSKCKRLNAVGEEAKNIRLLERGTQLRDALSENWRENGRYSKALEIIREAFVHEHFATASKPEIGVIIMNMHKAKGKQFDEVIIFEGWRKMHRAIVVSNSDRIVRMNSFDQDLSHSRQNLRVSVTRAKSQVSILTSIDDPCILLP